MLADLVRVTTRDGVNLDGALQRPPADIAPTVALDAVCLIHGTGGNFYSSTLFDVFCEGLRNLGCSVLRANTRGHDGISTAVTQRGGLRLGAAYEVVDDCRHDLAAWLTWLQDTVGPRVAFLGHSLGAVKCLYAAAQEPQHAPACLIVVSPPRLSYSWYCGSAQAQDFLATFQQAEALVHAGQPLQLIDVKLPLPFAIAAGGYVEKYGPDERYNFFKYVTGVPCPMLVLFGSVEVEKNMAFQNAPAELAELKSRVPRLSVQTIAGGDHFYSGVRDQAWAAIERWLRAPAD